MKTIILFLLLATIAFSQQANYYGTGKAEAASVTVTTQPAYATGQSTGNQYWKNQVDQSMKGKYEMSDE
jgi:hypothetical protein